MERPEGRREEGKSPRERERREGVLRLSEEEGTREGEGAREAEVVVGGEENREERRRE